jgi:hypothetical protein
MFEAAVLGHANCRAHRVCAPPREERTIAPHPRTTFSGPIKLATAVMRVVRLAKMSFDEPPANINRAL